MIVFDANGADNMSTERMIVKIGIIILKLLKTFLLEMLFIMYLWGMMMSIFSLEYGPVGMEMMSPFLFDIVEW